MNMVEAGSLRVDKPDADGQTILNIMDQQRRALPTIRRIVEARADPIMIDANGTTSVHLALDIERKDIAWLLLTLWKTKRDFGDRAGTAISPAPTPPTSIPPLGSQSSGPRRKGTYVNNGTMNVDGRGGIVYPGDELYILDDTGKFQYW
jgi:hypothetical protein